MSQDKFESIRKVQPIVLDIFKEFHKLCTDNGLRYFAIGGTAIGAIRHRGFIPWDDDIDVVMPRKDYEKFKEISLKLSEELEFIDMTEDPMSPTLFGKIQKTNTSYVSRGIINTPSAYSGVFMDIMPIDGVPSNKIVYYIHRLKLKVTFRMITRMVYEKNTITEKRDVRTVVKALITSLFFTLNSVESLKRRYVKLNKRYDFDTSRFLGRTWLMGTHDGMQAAARYYQEDFSDYEELLFEDTAIRMPIGYDRYLSSLYPNYMTLPPKDKQAPRHNDGIIDLNRSYKYYAAKKQGKTIGYTAGCYDMFHIGHLNILKQAKQHCDYLIVGVNSDKAMYSYKKKYPVISESERMAIVDATKYVDEVILVNDTDKMVAYEQHEYDTIFVGDDHKGEPKWTELEKKLAKHGSKVHYFGYTGHTSSTKLRSALDDMIEKKQSKK